jgi:hypothetical protein
MEAWPRVAWTSWEAACAAAACGEARRFDTGAGGGAPLQHGGLQQRPPLSCGTGRPALVACNATWGSVYRPERWNRRLTGEPDRQDASDHPAIPRLERQGSSTAITASRTFGRKGSTPTRCSVGVAGPAWKALEGWAGRSTRLQTATCCRVTVTDATGAATPGTLVLRELALGYGIYVATPPTVATLRNIDWRRPGPPHSLATLRRRRTASPPPSRGSWPRRTRPWRRSNPCSTIRPGP